MPKAVGKTSLRKRKTRKPPTEETYASSSESNVKLIKVLKGELSNTHLDDCNNDFAEFQSSRAPARKRRKQNPGEDVTRKAVSASVKASSVIAKDVVEEEKEHSSQEKHTKQSVRQSPRKRRRPRVIRESNKTEDVIEVKDGENTSEQGTRKCVRGGKEAKGESKEAETSSIEKVSEIEGKGLETSQGDKEELKNHGDEAGDGTEGGEGEELVPCPCCGRTALEIFPDGQGDMNNHALVCLHQKFSSTTVESNKPENSSGEGSKVPAEKQVIRCQICDRWIDHMSAKKRTEHINRCRDNATQSYGKVKGSVTQRLHSDYNGATTTDDEEEFFCLICSKNISHMNTRRRTQHVNRCIDSPFEEMKTSTPSSQNQPQHEPQDKPDVPSCIICGTSLNTHQKRKSHLKKCARENNISTLQLLDMVKKQELSSRDVPAAAEKPQSGQQQKCIRPREALSTGPATKAHKPRKKKMDDLDEDVQVAMAISASIAEQEEEEKRALGITDENIPEMLDTASSKAKGTKKKKRGRGRPAKHKPLNFPVLLTRTSPENHKMWAERIGAIVDTSSQHKRNVGKTPLSEKSELARIYSKSAGAWEGIGQTREQQDEDETTKPIWQLSRCDALLGNAPFYVNTLKPFVTPPKASKPRTKRLRFEESPLREAPTEAEKAGCSSPLDDLVHGAMTQEAVDALVGLAMEDEENTSRQRSFSPPASGFIRGNQGASNDEVPVVEPADDVTQEGHQLLASLRDLVDSPLLEPLTIKTKDGQSIRAHHFMLQLRCPALVKAFRKRGDDTLPKTVHLEDFTKSELLAVMSYLYAGDVSFPDSYVPQIEEFAKRYHLKDLQDICSKRLNKSHGRIVTPSKGGEQEKDIQDLIQSIWDDNEQTGSSHPSETSSDSLEEPPNLADLTEIYEIASSQRSRRGHRSSSSDNNSSDNDKMKNGELDNKEDCDGDRDADGENSPGEVSGDGMGRTQKREDRLKNRKQGSIDKGRGRAGTEKEEEDEEWCGDVSGCNRSSRGKDEKANCVSGDDELFQGLEEKEGRSENGLKEGVDDIHEGDEIGIAQNDEAMGNLVVRGKSTEIVTRSIGKEAGAEMTSANKDAQSFESMKEKGSGGGLRQDRVGTEGTVDEAESAVKSQSEMISKRDDVKESVEVWMDNGRSSAESVKDETGTQTDSNMEDTSSQRKKRGRPRKKVVSQSGRNSPPLEREGLISNLLGNLGRGETQGIRPAVEREGSPVLTPRKRGRSPKKAVGRKGESGIPTSSESDSIDQAVAIALAEGTNLSGSGKKEMAQREKNGLQKDSPSVTPRKRGRPRKYKVIEKEETGKIISSEIDSLDQPELVPSVELSTPPDCHALRELPSRKAEATGERSPGLTPRKRGRPRKVSSVKKKREMKSTNSESDSLDQAVGSPLSQASALSGSSSHGEVLGDKKEEGSLAPTLRKRERSKRYSVVKPKEGRMESCESDHLNLPENRLSLNSRTSKNLKNSQDEHNGSLKKGDSLRVSKRKPGRPRKSEGILKGGKKDGSPSGKSDGAIEGDEGIGRNEKKASISSSEGDCNTVFPYILQERRWSLRSPQSQESQEKGKSSPSMKSKSPGDKKKKSMPVRMPFLKLATKKKSFKFRRVHSSLSRVEQNDDQSTKHKEKSSSSDMSKESKIKESSGSEIKRQASTSSERSSTATEIVEILDGNGQSESNENHELDVSAALFENEEFPEVEITPMGERCKNSMDLRITAKPTNDFFSENYKVSEKFKFHASTPNDYLKYKDTISPLKVNLGRKVEVLHMRSVNHAGEGIEPIQDVNNSKGKENMPELTDGDDLSPVRIEKTLSFDDDGDGEDNDAAMPVVSLSPIQLSPSRVSRTPSRSSSPVFNSSSANQECKRLKQVLQKLKEGSEEGSTREEDEEIQVEEMEPNIPPRQGTPDASSHKSLNDAKSLSFSEGLCIGSGNDEELVSRSLSSQPIVSLSRRIPDSPVEVGKKSKEDSPPETDKEVKVRDDEEVKIGEEFGEDEVISILIEEDIQSVEGKSSKEDENGGNNNEIANREGEESEVPQGIDNAEEFAFDLEGENFEESFHLGPEEVVRTSKRRSSVTSPSSFGRPESASSRCESANDDAGVDAVDLTTDEEEGACPVKSVVLDEIDLTDDEEAIDLTDDEDVIEDADSSVAGKPESVSATPRVDVHKHTAEGTNGPTNLSQEIIVNGDALPGEIRMLPLIEGCSRSFMEDVAAAPDDEQFWSERELGMSPSTGPDMAHGNQNKPTVSTGQPATQILNARSITLEEFCSPAPITPMPPYDEMVTPQLTEELGRYGVKKLKRKQARLKLKELYHYTHQVMQEDESSSETTEESSKEKQVQEKESGKHKGAKLPEKSAKSKKHSTKPTKESKTGSKSSSWNELRTDPVFAEPREVSKSKSGAKPGAGKTGRAKGDKNRQPKRVAHLEAEKMDTDISSSQSSGSDERDDFGESILYDEEPDDIPPSQSTSNPEESIHKYIWNNPEFYQKCLQFQPFDLDEFQAELKANDIKVSKPKLMAILDAQCLTFRHKNRNRRSPKKKKKVP